MASHNIAQNLRDNNTNWQNVKQAIEDKGVSTSGLTTADYDDAIRSIVGSQPVLDTLNVTPSTTSQTITPPVGTDGYDEVNVAAVDNTIDSNIQAGNIKSGVQILGVTGNYSGGSPNLEQVTENPDFSNGNQVVTPSSGYDGMSQVTFNKPSTLTPGNVKKDVNIAGIVGTYEGSGANLQNKTVAPDFSSGNVTVNADSGYDGLGTVTIEKDADLIAGNIKKDVNLFGIVGSFDGGGATIYNEGVSLTAAGSSAIERRALMVDTKNNRLLAMDASNIYEYDVENDSWTTLATGTFLNNNSVDGTNARQAVCINGKIYVWDFGSIGWKTCKMIDPDTGTVTSLGNTGSPTGFCAGLCTDGTYMYLYDKNNKTIDKMTVTANSVSRQAVLSNITQLSYLKELIYLNGKLYAIADNKFFEIDIDNQTITQITAPVKNESIFCESVDGFYIIGGDTSSTANKIWYFDGTTLSQVNEFTDYHRDAAYAIFKGVMYEWRTENSSAVLQNTFKKLGDELPQEITITPSNSEQVFNVSGNIKRIVCKAIGS